MIGGSPIRWRCAGFWGTRYADVGRTITLIDDIDGDGKRELLLGSQTSPGYFELKEYVHSNVYVALSSSIGDRRELEADRDLLIVREARAQDQLGACVGRAGDLDGDGVGDLVIGAREAASGKGAAYLVSGARLRERAIPGVPIAVDSLSLLEITGESDGDLLGWSCADINADFDGDGIPEISLGARGADGYVEGAGAVYVVPGWLIRSKVNEGAKTLSIGEAGILKIGAHRRGARLGSKRRFSAGGDFDLDGINDLAVGTPGLHEGGPYAGAAWLIPGARIRARLATDAGRGDETESE